MKRLRKMLCAVLSALMLVGSVTSCGSPATNKDEMNASALPEREEDIVTGSTEESTGSLSGEEPVILADSEVIGDYKIRFITPELIDINKNYSFSLCGNELFYSGFDESALASVVYCTDLETMVTKELFNPADDKGESIGFGGVTAGYNGEVLIVGNEYVAENRFNYELLTFDSDGHMIKEKDVNTEESTFISNPAVLEGDRIICLVNGGSGNSFIGNIKQYNEDFRTFDDIAGLQEEYATSIGTGESGKTLLINNGDSLKRFDPASGSTTSIFDWQSVDIEGYKVAAMSEKNGELYVLISDYSANSIELAVISEADPSEKKEVTTIKLATLSVNDGLRQATSNFNRSQSDYRVELVEYQNGAYIGTQDDLDKLMIDLLGDDPCDLIDLSCFEEKSPDILDMITKGYIDNLTPYIENSSVIKLDDFEKKAVETCKYGDFLAAIPYSFEIWTCLADEEMVNEKGSIRVHDLIEYDRAHPDKIFAEGVKDYNILEALLYRNFDQFVDKEKGTCNFDSDSFKEIAEYACEYSSNPNDNEYYNFYSFGGKDDIVKYTYFEKLEYLNYNMMRFMGGKSTPIGMPTIDGSYRTLIDINGNGSTLGITSVSKNKEGAFKFIEFYLTMAPGDYWYGFPTNKRFLQRQIDKYSDENDSDNYRTYSFTYAGSDATETFEAHPLTEDEIKTFYKMIEYSEPKCQGYTPVIVIVYDELKPYFEGLKSLDDAVRIIQDRVSLYLAENSKV